MPVPVVLASCAAVGSLITSVKSGWELRRMIKRKQEQFVAEDEAPFIFRRLRRAHREGILNDREYEDWYEKFLIARAEKDLPALHRIRAHLRIMEAGAPGRALTSGSSRSTSKSSYSSSPRGKERRRRHSVDDAVSPRRSASPRERRRRGRQEESEEEEEEESDYYDEKRRTRKHSSRSSSVRDPRREKTWPEVGARPDQFVRAPKRASTATGYGTGDFAPGVVNVPILLPAPGGRSRSSSASAGRGRRYEEVESEYSGGSETEDTDYDEKKGWGGKKSLPPPRRERRRPWEEREREREEKRDRVKA